MLPKYDKTIKEISGASLQKAKMEGWMEGGKDGEWEGGMEGREGGREGWKGGGIDDNGYN